MIAWCHLPTVFNRRHRLLKLGYIVACAVLITTVFFTHAANAVAGNQTISFQGRLQSAAGAVVPDGHYNMQFKIYQGGSGSAAGNPDGSLKWTENYVNNNGTAGVEVRNGLFSVNLGSVTPFGSSVDWNQGTLWLSMNVAGSATDCTSFGTGTCAGDGEMLPMKQITATPYSLNAGAVGGKTADNLVQLGQGTQTDAGSSSSIAINKTGSGNLIQLQANGVDAFTLNSLGSITLGSLGNQSISLAQASSGSGNSLTLASGDAATGSGGSGGDLVLKGGAGDGIGPSGNIIAKSDSTGAFQVQSMTGSSVFNVDTVNNIVSVGTLKLTSSTLSGSGQTKSLWNNGTVAATSYNDSTPQQLGMIFKSDVAGSISGVRFYNPMGGNAGSDVGKLWACNDPSCSLSSGGTELGSVTFASDQSTGWKTANFATPIAISADTYYMVTHYTANGTYYATSHYFDTAHDATPLHAPDSATVANGSFLSNAGANFPTGTFNGTNYWIDVSFQASTTVDQVTSSNDFTLGSTGAMTVGPVNNSLTLQGQSINLTASSGSSVTIQGGGITQATFNGSNVKIGSGIGSGQPVLLTLDRASSAPTITDSNAMLGSMYYDTTLGKLQCYEAAGWGSCDASPDTFITLSPEYANSVTNGTGNGTMSSDFCSDTLHVNDGTSSQPTICGTNDTYNFYKWTSSQATTQARSIYVTYQLPSTFKSFIAGATSLTAKTDGTDASVSYQIYRNAGSGLVACGSSVSVSTGAQSTWKKVAASGASDPSSCSFSAGDSIVIKINLSTANNANAYTSNLNLTYSNQ